MLPWSHKNQNVLETDNEAVIMLVKYFSKCNRKWVNSRVHSAALAAGVCLDPTCTHLETGIFHESADRVTATDQGQMTAVTALSLQKHNTQPYFKTRERKGTEKSEAPNHKDQLLETMWNSLSRCRVTATCTGNLTGILLLLFPRKTQWDRERGERCLWGEWTEEQEGNTSPASREAKKKIYIK